MNSRFMRISIITIFLTILINTVSIYCNGYENRDIIVGIDEHYPPHEYYENGVAKGFNVDIIKSIAYKLNYNIKWQSMKWADAYQKLLNGEIDMLCMAASEERSKSFEFTDEALLDLKLTIFVKSDVVGLSEVSELAHHTVAVEDADISHNVLAKESPDAIIVPLPSQEDAIKYLESGNSFAYFGNYFTGIFLINRLGYEDIKVIGTPIMISPRVIAFPKGKIRYKNEFTAALRAMKESREYDKIYNKWFGTKVIKFNSILKILLITLAVILFILLIVIYWNRILRSKVTERTKELQDSEMRYRSIINNMPYGIVLLDEKEEINFINNAGKKILDIEGVEVKSLDDIKILNKKPIKNFITDIKCKKFVGPTRIENEVNNNIIVISIIGFQYIFNQRMIILIIQDITKEVNMEKHLFQAQKMESIGRLVGGISHDFNNILTGIISTVEFIKDHRKITGELKKDIAALERLSNKAADLTDKLLVFSRQEISNPQTILINDKIEKIHPILKRVIGENIDIKLYLEDAPLKVKIDPMQFEQIILNLASNANEAMPDGGKIIIETKLVMIDDKYSYYHEKMKAGEYVMLTFSDNGIGMDEYTVDHIFEPFFTTKESGTGLGLSTVYGIVKNNSGFIFVYSVPKRGTTFKIYFPYIRNGVSIEHKKSDDIISISSAGLKDKNIMIVEDDTDIRNIMVKFLEEMGAKVYAVKKGNAALRFINSISKTGDISEKPDILITDIILPDISGGEVAKKIENLYPDVKILFISGYTKNSAIHNGTLKYSDNRFLQKPFTLKRLLKELMEMVG